MPTSRKSKVPFTHFPTDLLAQRDALKSNPLLNRMKAVRTTHDDPHRPIFHYVNPEGTLNDPNGLCYWKDHWHLFYQAYPPEDTRQHWGHAISRDLIHWEDLPYCIYPDPEYQCFSGATFVESDRVIAMYHGTRLGNMVATSSDPLLLNWEKLGDSAVIQMPESKTDQPYTVFDPCIWCSNGKYYSLSGGQSLDGPDGQAVATDYLFESENLKDWTYLHPFIEGDRFTRVGDDGACPYFWPIGNRYILLFFSHSSGGQYLLGDYDEDQQKFLVTHGEKFNFGPPGPGAVHAPSATPIGDGSLIVIFNMNPAKACDGWDQIMSLPRRLTLDESGNDVLVQPIGDLPSLRGEEVALPEFALPANREVNLTNNPDFPNSDQIQGNAFELKCTIEPSDASFVAVDVLASPDREEYTRISVFRNRGYPDRAYFRRGRTSFITLDNSHSSIDPLVKCRAPETLNVFIDKEEPVELQIFVDRSIVEVFVNNRKCLGLRVYPSREDSVGVYMCSRGQSSKISKLQFFPLSSIYSQSS